MPEQRDPQASPVAVSSSGTPAAGGGLADRMRNLPGLMPLVREAEDTWRARAAAAGEATGADGRPGWRTFEDAFPTFYEFTNRPR